MSGYVKMHVRLFIAVLVWLAALPVYAEQEARGGLVFEVAVLQGAERHLDILAYPAYLVVALENNGIKPSNMSRVILQDERNVKFRNASLGFVERKGATFAYKAGVEWDMGVTQMKFDLPVEIDTSGVSSGRLWVRVYPPLAKLFPKALTERIQLKIRALTNEDVQKKMLGYFDGIASKDVKKRGVEGIIPQIMMQAYNTSVADAPGAAPREPGDAESLSDQAYLLATLAIWLLVVPSAVASYYGWRRFKRRKVGN